MNGVFSNMCGKCEAGGRTQKNDADEKFTVSYIVCIATEKEC